MKTAQRQHLKSNELVETLVHARRLLQEAGPGVWRGLMAAVVVVAVATAVFGWRRYSTQQALAALALAEAVDVAPVAPPPLPALPGQPAPPPPPAGSYPTEQARREAAIAKYLDVANRHGGSDAGRQARFRAAVLLTEGGNLAEAEQQFKTLDTQGGTSLFARMARLAVADLQVRQGQYEPAIATFRGLTTNPGDTLPVDALLMQLARAQMLAGRDGEAVQPLTRIVDEFPQSAYAADARRELDRMKAKAGS